MRVLLLLLLLSISTIYVSAQVNGMVFSDGNGNGIFDANDYVLAGALIEVLDSSDVLYTSANTNSDGAYFINTLPQGNYNITICSTDCFCSTIDVYEAATGESMVLDFPLTCNIIDLALQMTLAPNQVDYFKMGDLVKFDLTVYNQGTLELALIDVVNYVPNGLVLNDGNWFMLSNNIALSQIVGPVFPGTSQTTSIQLYVEDDSVCTITNIAEVIYQADIDSQSDLFAFNDMVQNDKINNENGDEDDHDIETIQLDCSDCPVFIDFGNAALQSGLYQAAQGIRFSGAVLPGSSVSLQAGQRIELRNDFKTGLETDFSAHIAPCSCLIDAPEFLVVDNVDLANNLILLKWNAVEGTNQYEIIYYVDGNEVGSFNTLTNSINLPLETSGVNHEFTVFSVCENGDTKQGPTIGYTLSEQCSTCLPPQNFDVRFGADGEIILTSNLPQNANFLVYQLFDENGEPLLNDNGAPIEIISESDVTIISTDMFPEAMFPEIFEVVLSIVCGQGVGAKRMMERACHSLSVIVITAEDIAARQGFCNLNGNQLYKIKCPHFPVGVSVNKFKMCHCDQNGNAMPEEEINCD